MDTKKEATQVNTTPNVLGQMSTFLNMLSRTPDLNVQVNDAYNFFYICMPFFKSKDFYENVFEDFYTKDNPESETIKLTIDMLMIRYKDTFGFEDVPYISPEHFEKLLMQGLVHQDEYEMFTGEKPKMRMSPDVENTLKMHNIKPEEIQLDLEGMETIHLDPTSTGSTLVDDAIKDAMKN